MKHIVAFAIALTFLAPAFAIAQPNTTSGPNDQAWGQMFTLRQQERSQMLAALTPAHRRLLSAAVGELAISPQPNPDAIAAKLNAALSPREKHTILKLHHETDTAIISLMQNMHDRAGMPGSGPSAMSSYGYGPGMMGGGNGYGPGMMGGGYGYGPRSGAWNDAGHLLLFIASSSRQPAGGPARP